MEVVKDDQPEKQVVPKSFSIKGKIEFEIKFDGENLDIQIKSNEEGKLVCLFGALQHMKQLDNFIRTPEGKDTFELKERTDIICSRHVLSNIVTSFASIVYKKMVKSMPAEESEFQTKPQCFLCGKEIVTMEEVVFTPDKQPCHDNCVRNYLKDEASK